MNEPDISPELKAIVDHVNEVVDDWKTKYDADDFVGAAAVAKAAIAEICDRAAAASGEFTQVYYGLRILLNVLRDIANLEILTSHEVWLKVPKAVEKVWDLAQDTKKRLSVIDPESVRPEFLEFCKLRACDAIDEILNRYGEGIYCSWEMEFDGLQCSLCDSDIRGCDHVPGRWYGESLCHCTPIGGTIVATALVHNPADLRCRIWPWMWGDSDGKGRVFNAPIYMIYDEAGDEDGGWVAQHEDVFPSILTVLNVPHRKAKFEILAYRKLNRRELLETVRTCLKERKLKSPRNCRMRFITLIGSEHRRVKRSRN